MNTPYPSLSDALHEILLDSGYQTRPEFVVVAHLTAPGKAAIAGKLGSGISAVAIFEDSIVHVVGRLSQTKKDGLSAANQVLVREISLKSIDSVVLSSVPGVGGTLSLKVKDKGGLLSQLMSGGDVVLVLSENQLRDQRDSIGILRERFS